MARLAVTLTVIFSLFILSHARFPFTIPSNDDTELKSAAVSSESDTKDALQTIRLPSEKSESDAVQTEELPESETIQLEDLPESNTNTISAIGISRPLTVTYDVSFRPINRHFHHMYTKRPLWYRFHHHCRHHGKPIGGPQSTAREISYGNDMITSDKTDFDPMFRNDGRQISARIGDLRRVNEGWLTEVGFKMPEHVEDKKESEGKDQEEEDGLMKRFRKFLNRF